MKEKYSVIKDVKIGKNTKIHDHVNLYKCIIGDNCKIDAFVYIEEGVVIGNNCKIRPFVFIPQGVTIGNNVFIGPHVVFTNDKYPKIKNNWKLLKTIVEDDVSIGAGSIILPGVKICKKTMIGAGSIIAKDIPPNKIVYGVSAKIRREIK